MDTPTQTETTELEAKPQTWKTGQLQVRKGVGIVLNSVEDVWNTAVFMCNARMVPDSYKENGQYVTAKVAIALIKGLELGLSPTVSVQRMYVVNNQPAMWGEAVIGLLLESGKLEDFTEIFEGEYPNDNFTAVCTLRRKGIETPMTKRFSVEDAKRANLWHKKDTWTKSDKQMLTYRARGFCARSLFGDVLMGLHVEGELDEVIDVQAVETPRTQQFANHLDSHPLAGGDNA
ncbi:MAG: hypothetical protein ACRCYY_17605 [Trueperaceae bacterium]